jgi:hypothetical protein
LVEEVDIDTAKLFAKIHPDLDIAWRSLELTWQGVYIHPLIPSIKNLDAEDRIFTNNTLRTGISV